MTPERIAEHEDIIGHASPGPWWSGCHCSGRWLEFGERPDREDLDSQTGMPLRHDCADCDGEFIAAARTMWPEAIEEVKRLSNEIEFLKKAIANEAKSSREYGI